MIKICFIANFEKTAFFEAIADKILEQKKHEIYWIVVNKKQSNKLMLKYGKKNICLINKKIEGQLINENLISKIKLNEILYQDRSLNTNSIKHLQYLELSCSKIYQFLKENEIMYVYGEITWAHEIITYKICNLNYDLNCKFYSPSTVRFPLSHFLFFTNSEQSKFFIRKNKAISKITNYSEDYLSLIKKIRPNKLYLSYDFILKKIRKIFHDDYFDRHDPTRVNRLVRGINLLKKYVYLLTSNFIIKNKLDFLEKEKYIIYFLQKQPEAAIDVKGAYYDDQLMNFKNLWRLIPSDFKIILKEHPNAIGDNSLSYYRQFTKYNNTLLVRDFDNFENVVSKAFATFSVASTASIESAMLNVPSFTFVKCFFNEIKNSYRVSLEDIKNFDNIYDLKNFFYNNNDTKNNIDQSNYIQNCFHGEIIRNEKYEKENLTKIANAFIETTVQSNEAI